VAHGSSGTLALVEGEVVDSGCAAPLGAELLQPELELLIRGGRYAAGPAATRPVRFQAVDVVIEGDTSFDGTTLEFGNAARGIVGPAVSVTGTREPFRMDRSAQVLACPAEPTRCAELCAGEKPPRWCPAAKAPAAR
jgi:hypothetical protein